MCFVKERATTERYPLCLSDALPIAIGKASSTTTVNCALTAQTYTGSPIEACTASYSGAGGLAGTLTPTYTSNTNDGTPPTSSNSLIEVALLILHIILNVTSCTTTTD